MKLSHIIQNYNLEKLRKKVSENFDALQIAYEVAQGYLEEYDYCVKHYSEAQLAYYLKREKEIQKELKKTDDIRQISQYKLKESMTMHKEVQDQIRYQHRLVELSYKLIPLQYIIQGHTRKQVLKDLENEEWEFKHQIITRWGWMDYQRKQIKAKQRSKFPFECKLGRWDIRNTEDYEFYVLLHFLPEYKHQTKKEYLYYKRHDERQMSPDFILSNGNKEMGIEMTMAPQTDSYGKLLSYQSQFNNQLRHWFENAPFAIKIDEISSWHDVFIQAETIKEACDLSHLLYKSEKLRNQTFQWDNIRVSTYKKNSVPHITIKVDKERIFKGHIIPEKNWSITVSRGFKRDTKDQEMDDIETCLESILHRINDKHRSKPEANTILVIWPINEFVDLDYQGLCKQLRKHKKDIPYHQSFKETWLFTGNRSYLLF